MKAKGLKLLIFLLLGVSLAFGLLTSRMPQPSAPAAADPNEPKIPVSALPPTLRTKAQMLTEISQYKQKAWTDRVYYRRNERNRRYVPDEIIVKYKEDAALMMANESDPDKGARIKKTGASFDALNQKYKARNIRPLIKNIKKKPIISSLFSSKGHEDPQLTQSKPIYPPELNRLYKLTVEPEAGQSLRDVVDAYNNCDDIEYAELNYIVSASDVIPDDPLFETQWALNNVGQQYLPGVTGTPGSDIDAPHAWDIATGSGDIIVAVIDTGVDYSHRDLNDNMWTDPNGNVGYDFVNDDNDPNDDNGHGTHCAGIIGAEGNNGLDIAGVCWNVKIMAVKFLNAQGAGSTGDAVQAIYYAVSNGARVLSNSWGGPDYSSALAEAIDYAQSQGVIIVAAAGNEGNTIPQYPANNSHVMSVAATDSDDHRAGFSTYGEWVDIAAPGVDILSLRASGALSGPFFDASTTVLSGTSMACPYVAGACALLLSANPLLTSNDVQNILVDSVDLIEDGYSISASGGRLNIAQAAYEATPSRGRVTLDKAYYTCSGPIGIRLSDADIAGQGLWDVRLMTSGGDVEILTLEETNEGLGVFQGTILTDTGQVSLEDGLLQIDHGDSVAVEYEDADDGSGNAVRVSDTALFDCMGPNITNVQINGSGSIITITFETDEMATAVISGSLSCGESPLISVSSPALTTRHTVTLRTLEPETEYFFIIECSDSLGNSTIDDNDGDCYQFTTASRLFNIFVPIDFSTIQEAIDRAWDGDAVWVEDGTYTGPGNVDIDFSGKEITVRSQNGPDNCIIDCRMSGRGFFFHSQETSASVLDGFTIKNGYPAADVSPQINFDVWLGGGIYCKDSYPTITNCIITDNYAPYWGGGICILNTPDSPTVHIRNCTISRNQASVWGGGISCDGNVLLTQSKLDHNTAGPGGGGIDCSGQTTIDTCTITDNFVYEQIINSGYGGGVFASGDFTMINSVIRGNEGYYGGGLFYFDDQAVISNCLFSGNSAFYGGGISYYGRRLMLTNCTASENSAVFSGGAIGYYLSGTQNNTIVENCIVWNNQAGTDGNQIAFPVPDSTLNVSHSDIKGGDTEIVLADSTQLFWDSGNINVDPNFALDQDYHLVGLSPCINRGTNEPVGGLAQHDIEGNQRLVEGSVDMGAYEFESRTAAIAVSPRAFQFNGTEFQSDPDSQTLFVRNSGGGLLSWQIQEDCPWLQVSVSSGSSEGQIEQIELMVQTSGLPAGNYECALTVSDSGANNSPKEIPVRLHVSGTLHVPSIFPTLQSAIQAAWNGDNVLVADGVYTGNGNRDIGFYGKTITVKSQNGPDYCVIDCNGTQTSPHRGLSFSDASDCLIDGFTITGGYVNSDYYAIFPPSWGGGIYSQGNSLTIQNCKIENNSCSSGIFPGWGGGMMIEGISSDAIYIRKCKVQNNHADASGGGLFSIAPFLIENSIITQNDSPLTGGGIHYIPYYSADIINCTLAQNTSDLGGGIFVDGGSGEQGAEDLISVANSILAGNSASNGSQVALSQFYSDLFAQADISYCDIEASLNAIYQEEGFVLNWGAGNLDADPLFVDPGNNNYRLQPFSLVIDKGSNKLAVDAEVDLDGGPRFLDADYDGLPEVDMGAYEFVPAPFQGQLIEISDWEFNFVAFSGEDNPPPQTFRLRNSGTGSLDWQITTDCPWFFVLPLSGQNSGEFTEVVLQPDTTGLVRGFYTCQLAVESLAAANHPRTFTVNLRVFERGKLFVPDEFPTIQQAVNFAEEGDQVIIAPGTYIEDIFVPGKNITLTSQDPNDWEVVADTVISGSGSNPAVAFAGTERSARLMGLTVAGGAADSGGGIQGSGTGASIEKCIIRENTASVSGGGIHAVMGRIADCVISSNTAEFGGGIADCNDVVNCIITSNQASEGGGLYQADGSIVHCTITDNSAIKGAGASRCTGLILNSIIWANDSGQLYQCSRPSYSCVQFDPRGTGNIDIDPEFIDPASGDYRLGPGSFCIDSAISNTAFLVETDIVGFLRSFDGNNDGTVIPDMGAYEMPLWNQPVIGITQNQFAFTDTGPAVQTFTIWNASLPPVQYTVSDPNCSWLSVFPMAGTVYNAPQEITLTVNAAQVPPGVYTCQFTISDPAAINSPRTVNVRLTVFQDIIHLTPAGPTIQHALSYVSDGGTLLLADGVYSGPGNRDIDFRGRPATVKSINGPENCIIDLAADPNIPARGFLFGNGEGSDSMLDGLSIINGYTPQSGGAVFCDGSSPTITDCIFRNNRSEEDGGAVYAQRGLPVIDRCVFEGNAADRGGAASAYQGGLSMSGTDFLTNTAVRRGGAVFVNSGSITAAVCHFTQNSAANGGAMFHDNSNGELADCIFTENAATLQDWNYGGGAIFNVDSDDLRLQGCQFIENAGGWDGGAIENWRSSPHIVQCEFTGNIAAGNDGGALFNIFGSDPNILRCTFTGNLAKSWGGAMRNRQSSPRIANCLFVSNDAVDNGGAIFNFYQSNPTIVNCTFSQNTANSHEGGAVYSLNTCFPQVANSIFWANEAPQVFDSDASTTIISYSTIDWPGSGNIAQDPLFNDPNNGNFRLLRTSPCIDSGRDVSLVEDLTGDLRPWDCPWAANAGAGFDRGAFEFAAVPAALKITPTAINLKSRGKDPAAQVVFPDGMSIRDVDFDQPLMFMTEKFAFTVENGDFSTKKGRLMLEIPIHRGTLAEYCEADGRITVSVTVPLADGQTAYGTDAIRILHASK